MSMLRALVSVCLAVAIGFAPVASAWATAPAALDQPMAALNEAAVHQHAGQLAVGIAGTPMADCASTMTGDSTSGASDCCDTDTACAPEACVAKCFQFVGLALPPRALAGLMRAQLRSTKPAPSPDWSQQPQPRPPRD